MKQCPYCSAEIEESSRFCLYCMTSLDSKKVIHASKIKTKRWHFSIAAFLVFAIFTISLLAVSRGKDTPLSSSGFSQNETSFYSQDSSETTSYLPPSSETEQTHSNSTSTSSKNSASASISTSNKTSSSTSTSSKATTSTSSDVPVSSQPIQSVPKLLSENDCTYRISGSEAILIEVNSISGDIILPEDLDGYPLTTISTAAFNSCTSITSIALPNGIKDIGLAAFKDCTVLKNINIPEGISELKGFTFSGCTSLTSIILPSTLTSVGKNAFENCASLADIYFTGSEEKRENITFNLGNDTIVSSASWHYNYKR